MSKLAETTFRRSIRWTIGGMGHPLWRLRYISFPKLSKLRVNEFWRRTASQRSYHRVIPVQNLFGWHFRYRQLSRYCRDPEAPLKYWFPIRWGTHRKAILVHRDKTNHFDQMIWSLYPTRRRHVVGHLKFFPFFWLCYASSNIIRLAFALDRVHLRERILNSY